MTMIKLEDIDLEIEVVASIEGVVQYLDTTLKDTLVVASNTKVVDEAIAQVKLGHLQTANGLLRSFGVKLQWEK